MIELIPQRVELFHPLLVHFPIALLLAGALARLILFFCEISKLKSTWLQKLTSHVRSIFFWSWILGCVGLVAAYLSGDSAEGVINKIICDPTVTHEHEDFAVFTLIAAGTTLVTGLARWLLSTKLREKIEHAVLHFPKRLAFFTRLILAIELLALAATVSLLTWTAHLGGTLVYEQGAGYLRTPNEQCEGEFGSMLDGDESNDAEANENRL
ncbi:hypothetical protein EBU99_08485 [bacterium]|nr:hypothetical protein [bacterium]